MNGLDEAKLRQCRIDLDSIWDGVIAILEREEGEGDVANALGEISQGICQSITEIEDWLEIEEKDRYT